MVNNNLGCVIYSDTELLELLQVVVEGLDVCEHTHGVWLVPHVQHVLHLDQTEAVSLLPETQKLMVKVSDFTNTVNGTATSIGYFFPQQLTLRWWRPAGGCVCGLRRPACCNQTPEGRKSGPERRTPSHRSSWTRSSGCLCSERRMITASRLIFRMHFSFMRFIPLLSFISSLHCCETVSWEMREKHLSSYFTIILCFLTHCLISTSSSFANLRGFFRKLKDFAGLT